MAGRPPDFEGREEPGTRGVNNVGAGKVTRPDLLGVTTEYGPDLEYDQLARRRSHAWFLTYTFQKLPT